MAISAAESLMRRIVRRSGQAIVSFTANSSPNHLSLPPLVPPARLLRFECQYFPRKAWIVKLIASISRAKTFDKRTRVERGEGIKWGGRRKCAGKGDDEGGHVEKARAKSRWWNINSRITDRIKPETQPGRHSRSPRQAVASGFIGGDVATWCREHPRCTV